MQTMATAFKLTYYIDGSGRKPFREWLYKLRDRTAIARITTGLERVELGNLGDHKSVGSGVMELRTTTALDIASIMPLKAIRSSCF